jgi:hypothetical protein
MIEKISVKNIVAFKRKSDKSQATFINNLNRPKQDIQSDGGDYWVMASSTVSNFFKAGNKELISEKIEDVSERRNKATAKISKDMYQRNIAILNSFEDFDFSKFKPNTELFYLSKPKEKSIIKLKGVPLQIRPHHVFSFNKNKIDKIGAVWFVVKLGGYEISDIAIFTDALYRYLKTNHKKFEVDLEYCLVFDLINQKHVRYTQIKNGKIISALDSTLERIKKLL